MNTRAREQQQLKARIGADIAALSARRAVNSMAVFVVMLVQIGFTAAAVWITTQSPGTAEDWNSAAVLTSISGLTTLVDNTLRLRETAAQQHEKIIEMREILLRLEAPSEASPQWGEYITAKTDGQTIDYIHAILYLCSRNTVDPSSGSNYR